MKSTTQNIRNLENIPWYLKELLLPLIVTFLTYIGTNFFFTPVSTWRKLKEEVITILIQYANYTAYSYEAKNGKRKFEDRGLYNIIEQDLRRLAGRIYALPNYFSYKIWRALRLLPSKEKIERIRSDLIGWANSLVEKDLKYDPSRNVRIESLKKNLNLPNNYKQMKRKQELEWKRS